MVGLDHAVGSTQELPKEQRQASRNLRGTANHNILRRGHGAILDPAVSYARQTIAAKWARRVLGVGFGVNSTGDGGQCGVMAVLNHHPVSPPQGQLANPGSPSDITNSRPGLAHAGRVGGSLRHACLRTQTIERGCSGCRGAQQVRLRLVAIFQPSRN